MDTVADTVHGRLRGRYSCGAHTFRGIRYGESTGGASRFCAPRAAKNWAGIRDAVVAGPCAPQLSCPQNADPFFAWYSAIDRISEDCLFLNLFTPGLTGKRPVMVWLHGGGWTNYSGTAPGFDGTVLAQTEDVVVVSINHRLGIFGHLRLESSDERFLEAGNNGILDVVLALEWVRDNAACFGGDPDNVTIFGESGGASKVVALLAMRRAQGLFHRAIIQSLGSGTRLAARDEAQSVSTAFMRALGCEQLDPPALQTLPMEQLLAAVAKTPPARAMIDDVCFDAHPFDKSAPATAADIPLLIGCTRTECSYYMRDDDRNFTLQRPDVLRRMANFFGVSAERASGVMKRYEAAYPSAQPSELLMLSCSDYMFKRPTYSIAALQAQTARAPVYAYHFEWETPVENGRMRSPHTSEIPFNFGTISAARACVGSGSDRLMRAVMASWAAFARSGNPANPFVPEWLPYDPINRRTMCLDIELRLESDPGGEAREALEGLPFYSYGKSMLPMTAG